MSSEWVAYDAFHIGVAHHFSCVRALYALRPGSRFLCYVDTTLSTGNEDLVPVHVTTMTIMQKQSKDICYDLDFLKHFQKYSAPFPHILTLGLPQVLLFFSENPKGFFLEALVT